ncbi:hypothetical protein THASP1DRAFT_21997 [Thamnocephalis sphaerospora]|uniref:Cns1/TTC4 wheel domain-containing protein n=1 Tax=Thamnocephalis sphaerospora TaxID=78915 RepID=A0A4P9XW49_9FUNG|nr:hypothetical protein THASP1DRAFT_21997 [Thamnocephalis sphaerospora]|eukprot:RKP10262.1 hypothetical protein THASP1DRAFT_21997 [Thamnocephalis sphaerospora]
MSNTGASAGPQRNRAPDRLDEDRLVEELNRVPLFMQELPEDAGDNVTLQALQALAYDGTPEENAENFKNQGNDCFRLGKSQYKNAIEYYTRALNEKCEDTALNVACLINRAACNLELQNYRRVLNDCAKAITLDAKCVKAYYRSAKACRALEKVENALDACDRGLAIDPENKALLQEKELIRALEKKLADNQAIKKEREDSMRAEQERISQAIQERGLRMITRPPPPDNPHPVHIDPETGNLVWPVFFLYPEYKESDLIAAFDETSTFEDHLQAMFGAGQPPAPWDQAGIYRPELLEVYFETVPLLANNSLGNGGADGGVRDTKLVKVGRRCTLAQVLRHRSFTVVNRIPSFIILPAVSPFKATFLARYAK